METKNTEPEAAGTEPVVMEGTSGMRYWDFRKEFCAAEGWRLRATDPQVYDVLNNKGEKIGVFKSGEGYFPTVATA
ncbi:MAG TPA: hypothetical protein PK250_19305 [Syntrophobacter fumaroxidans]|nr:hypothetical protein [Syntrophobacter fumaroxidans]